MPTNAERIREFHETMGSAHPNLPQMPSVDTLTLRRTLIEEEVAEVMHAFAQALTLAERATGDESAELAHLVHELADLLYVTYGAMTACGVDADAVFAEVHRANMQKASGPRRADGKVLKPPDFKSADVAAVLARQTENGAG